MNHSIIITTPASLFIGNNESIVPLVEKILKNIFCPFVSKDQCFCIQCRQINQHQHSKIIWIKPEHDYTVDTIAIIFDRIRFKLDDGEKYFFVLEHAENMNSTTANRLLKVLEEPPTGYHFILLTNNADTIIPTIRSRCIEQTEYNQNNVLQKNTNPLILFFLDHTQNNNPLLLETELKKQHLSDSQSIELAQILLEELLQQWKLYIQKDNATQAFYIKKKIDTLLNILKKPPQSGSSDLFWKHIFLEFLSETP